MGSEKGEGRDFSPAWKLLFSFFTSFIHIFSLLE